MKFNNYSNTPSPKPWTFWNHLSNQDRLDLCRKILKNEIKIHEFKIIDAKQDGQVIIEFKKTPVTSKRGMIMLDIEEILKTIDESLTVWHLSIGDKNSLRNLRGIVLKNES